MALFLPSGSLQPAPEPASRRVERKRERADNPRNTTCWESVAMWPIRSALFVPAHRRDWVGKAIRVSPGAVILDIEDSVPSQFKPQAMEYLKDEIAELKA